MPSVARLLAVLFLFPTSYTLSTPVLPGNDTPELPDAQQDPSTPDDGSMIDDPNILSSLLHPQPSSTNAVPLVSTTQAPISQSAGDLGPLGGLLSIVNTILNPLTNLPDGAPLVPDLATVLPAAVAPLQPLVSLISSILSLPQAGNPTTSSGDLLTSAAAASDSALSSNPAMPLPIVTTFVTVIDTNLPAAVPLSALLPSITVPTAVIPALASDLGPLISQLGSNLPSAMPVLMSLGSMLNSEASGAAIPEVQSLTALIASEVASLTQEVLSATVLVPTVLPVMSLELPSSTIAIPVPTSLAEQLAGLSLPTGAPLSELAATLSGIVGSDNSGLIDSIVGAIVSTLDGMVLSSQVNSLNSLIGGIPVAAGSVISAVTQEFCSQLSMVGGSMITIAVPCDSGSTATTSSGDSSAGASPVFPGAMSASVTITGPPLSELSVSVWTTMTASPSTTTAVSTTITGSPPISQTVLTTITLPPVSVTFSSSGIASSSSGPTLMTVSTTTLVVTVTNVEISTVTTCPAATSTASLTCPKLPPCPSCPITLACPSGTDIGGSNTDASSSGICSVSTDTGNGGSLVPSRTAGSNPGPCPGEGYTCDDCVDGWFCPPPHTSAQPAPCGYGWPCYHCAGGWFCVPSATLAPTTVTVCPLSVPGNPTPHTTTVAYMTLTSTAMVVIPEPPLPSETLHPALAGWKYAGCYKDDEYRALKNSSVTTAVVGGMTNEKCIVFCNNQGFGLAGTEDAYQCFCGDFLVDSWLLADSDCDSTCESDASSTCGGRWALSVWSPDGHVPMAIGPEEEFVMPTPTPGQTEMSVVTGGVRQTIIQITTPVFEFPAPETMTDMDIFPMTGSALTYATKMLSGVNQLNVDNINVEDIASTVHAIVSAAMAEAQQIAAAEVAKANSMVSGAKNIVGEGFEKMAAELNGVVAGAFPERIAWTTCSTTITSCSSTTTLSTTMTCTTSSPTTTSPSSGGSAAPVGNQPSVSSPTSSTVPGTLSTPDSTVTVSELTVTIGPSGTGSAAPVQLSTTSPSSSSLPSSPTSGIGTTPTSTPLSGAASAHPIGLSVTPFSTSAATSPGLSTPFPSLDHGSSPDNPSGTASVPTSAQTGQTPTATTLSISTPSLDHGSAPTNNPSPSLDHGNAPTESLSPSLDHGSAPTDNPSGVNSAAPVWNSKSRPSIDTTSTPSQSALTAPTLASQPQPTSAVPSIDHDSAPSNPSGVGSAAPVPNSQPLTATSGTSVLTTSTPASQPQSTAGAPSTTQPLPLTGGGSPLPVSTGSSPPVETYIESITTTITDVPLRARAFTA